MVGLFAPKNTVQQLLSTEWCLGALHHCTHGAIPASRKLPVSCGKLRQWEGKHLTKSASGGLEADHTQPEGPGEGELSTHLRQVLLST